MVVDNAAVKRIQLALKARREATKQATMPNKD